MTAIKIDVTADMLNTQASCEWEANTNVISEALLAALQAHPTFGPKIAGLEGLKVWLTAEAEDDEWEISLACRMGDPWNESVWLREWGTQYDRGITDPNSESTRHDLTGTRISQMAWFEPDNDPAELPDPFTIEIELF